MSAYWAAYYGVALVLDEREYIDFSNRFGEIFPDSLENGDILEEGNTTTFQNSAGMTVDITKIPTDNCDGMYLIPFVQEDGNPNIFIAGKESKTPLRTVKGKNMRNGDCYAVFADKDMIGPGAFIDTYHSYSEIKKEFQEKLKEFLPENFDWDRHIGVFSYACYA